MTASSTRPTPAAHVEQAHSDTSRAPGLTQPAPAVSSGPRAAPPSGAAQTPAGAAAAAAAQAALAAPPPLHKQAPKYNPPGTSQPPSNDRAQQQQPVSALQALATAGIHHPPPRASASSQELGRGQSHPQGPTLDPRLSHQHHHQPQQGGQSRAQHLPFPDSRPHAPHQVGNITGPGPTPSQQITAQAARHTPQHANHQQQQGAVNGLGPHGPGPLPPPMLQFGSVQPVPNVPPRNDADQAGMNPLHFGIPAGMLPGAKLDTGAAGRGGNQPMLNQASQGLLQPSPGQDVPQGRQGVSEGPWQPLDAEQQKEFMRQKAAQRQQAQVGISSALSQQLSVLELVFFSSS